MANKITTEIDFETGKAKAKLSDIKTAVADADGFTGKLKAGFGSLGDTIAAKMSGPAGIAAVGGAFAAAGDFAIGAVSKFSALGVEIGKLKDATGLSADEASRWFEVVGDAGVNTDAFESAVGRFNKTLGNTPSLVSGAGIEIEHLKDGSIDVNGTLLNVIDKLKGIKNPAEKAALASKLLGKGWQEMAELIERGSGSLKGSLRDVNDAKVFDDDKIQKAREFREATDNLKDVMEEFTITIGTELAPALSGLAETSADLLGIWGKLFGGVGNFVVGVKEWALNTFSASEANKTAAATQAEVAAQIAETDKESRKLASGMGEIHDAEQEAASAATVFKTAAANALQDAQLHVAEMQAAWDELHNHISQEKSLIQYKQQIRDVKDAQIEAWKVTAEKGPGSPESIEAIENARLKTLDLEESTADLAQKYTDMPEKKVTDLIAQIDSGSIEQLPGQIQSAIDSKTYRVNAHIDNIIADGETHAAGTAKGGVEVSGARAEGGPVRAGEAYTVGERGQETFVPNTNGTILPYGAGGPNITNHFHGITDPREMARQQAREIGWQLRAS